MSTKLQLRGTQQLTITPVMHHFIQLLTNNRLEFIDSLENEVESNPMLELERPETETTDIEPPNEVERRLERADSSFLSRYEEQGFVRRSDSEVDKSRAMEALTPSTVTFQDHLMEQSRVAFKSETQVEIARQIIYNLDRQGYLKFEIESIASLLQTTPVEIEGVRRIILTFDPPGCAAKTLQECLLAQLDAHHPPLLRLMIENHLEDLSRSRYEIIAKRLNVNTEEVLALAARLRRLNPRPAEAFEKEEVAYAEVDLMLIKEGNEYKVVYIDEGLPRLLLSEYYRQMLDKTHDRQTRSYLKSKYRDAQFFIESVELRKKTILRIAEFLVKAQKDYLDFGDKWKKPLTMKDAAREVNLNESTVSRAVSNKFIASDKGLIPLKSFFSHGLKGDFGFSHSVGTIKEKLKEIVALEPPEHPLSDDDIARKLAVLGIRIARRTVRNYREEMNIASSFIRKKEHQIKGVKR
jgi:RNA polymerase sigma-54 factor